MLSNNKEVGGDTPQPQHKLQEVVNFKHQSWYKPDNSSFQYADRQGNDYIKYSIAEQINRYLNDHPNYLISDVKVLLFDHPTPNVNGYYHDHEEVLVIFNLPVTQVKGTPNEK